MKYTPKQINVGRSFYSSPFGNIEAETIVRNLVIMQRNTGDVKKWESFTWEDYKAFCTHNVGIGEKGVLDALVNGGKPVTFTSAHLQKGWLTFSDNKYHFTEKIVNMLGEKYPVR